MPKQQQQQAGGLGSAADVARLISSSRRILVAAGAGMSVSCGIPDFRSEKTGLYTSGRHIADGIPSAELFFDFEYFKIDPAPFFKVAKSLVEINPVPSKTHDFLCMLENMGKIQKIYTQNIDGLERAAGCGRVVHGHGTMQTFHCMRCKRKGTLAGCKKDFVDCDTVPYCRFCRTGVMVCALVLYTDLLYYFVELMHRDHVF
jgi:NAD-dependent SIR2 family protein deacetylase